MSGSRHMKAAQGWSAKGFCVESGRKRRASFHKGLLAHLVQTALLGRGFEHGILGHAEVAKLQTSTLRVLAQAFGYTFAECSTTPRPDAWRFGFLGCEADGIPLVEIVEVEASTNRSLQDVKDRYEPLMHGFDSGDPVLVIVYVDRTAKGGAIVGAPLLSCDRNTGWRTEARNHAARIADVVTESELQPWEQE